MKVQKISVEAGEELHGDARKIICNYPERIIYTKEIQAGERKTDSGGYKQVTKLRIWYYDI